MTNDVAAIAGEILEEGVDDWVPIDRLIGLALEAAGEDHFKNLFKQAINCMLINQWLEAGTLEDEGFRPWVGSPEAIAERVIKECESFGWQPLGGGCWLSNTAAGDEYASTLDS